jgi:hypothetical protein
MDLSMNDCGEEDIPTRGDKMISIKIKGLDSLNRKLKQLERNSIALNGKRITVRSKEEMMRKVKEELFKGV